MATHHDAASRLFDRLDAGTAAGLALVCAPPGTGKTHVVARWAAERRACQGARIAWLSLGDDDRDRSRFVQRLAVALWDESAHGSARAAADEGSGHRSGSVAAVPPRRVVVLDNFERVVGADAERQVERLLSEHHRQADLVVISRIDPRLGQQRLHLAGRVTEIRSADLALTSTDVAGLLEAHDVALSPEQLHLLRTRTAGWAAAVEIVAVALGEASLGAEGLQGYLEGLPMSEPRLAEYLAAEVWESQPGPVRRFVDRVGLLDEVCASLADALTGHDDGEELLGALARAQLVTPVRGRADSWYQWNPLLGAFLRQRLHSRSGRLEKHLHRLASDWYADAGRPAEAVEHALLGWGDRLAAAKLREWWLDIFLSERPTVLGQVLALLDEEVVSADPRLTVLRGFTAARRDDLDGALAHARAAVSSPAVLSTADQRTVQTMAAVVELYAACMIGGTDDDALRETTRRLLESREAVPPGRRERIERALLRYQLGAFETSRLGYDDAVREITAAMREAELLRLPYLQLSCHAQLAELSCQAGRLNRAEQQAEQVLSESERTGWQSRLGLTTTHLVLAQVAMLRDDLDTALRHLKETESVLRPPDVLNKVRLRFLEATAVCTTGKVEAGGAALVRLDEEAGSIVQPTWVSELMTAAAARHDACQGKPEVGLLRMEAHRPVGRSPSPVRPYAVLRADLMLRCDRPEEAATAVDKVSKRQDGVAAYVGALVVKALVAERLDRPDEALTALAAALRAAAPDRIIQPFVAPGPEARTLLERLLDRGTADESMALEILSHMDVSGERVESSSSRSPYFVEPLSRREREVLERLQSTMTNAEIAGDLFISVNTLRTHMKNIDRKLGAANRRDAVRRARELGIL